MASKAGTSLSRKRDGSVELEVVERPRISSVDSLSDPSLFVNRELSLLAFQRRVLEEAQDPTNPLLERVKFLSILGSNLDEFFMVRVAGLMRQVESGTGDTGADGMDAASQLDAIRTEVASIMAAASKCFQRQLTPALEKAGIHILQYSQLGKQQQARADKYFLETVFPVLTPLALDPARPFPHISNLSLNLAVLIRDKKGDDRFARVKVPDTLPQLIPVDRKTKKSATGKDQYFIWLEDLIAANLSSLFPGMDILDSHPFHVTRDADIEIQELEAGDLLETTEEGLRQRKFGDVVRLRVGVGMPSLLLKILLNNLEVDRKNVLRMKGHLALEQAEVHCGHRSSGAERSAVRSRGSTCARSRGRRGGYLLGDAAPRRAAASSVRFVPAGDRFAGKIGDRSVRACHQDDACTAWAAIRRWLTRCWRRWNGTSRSPAWWN